MTQPRIREYAKLSPFVPKCHPGDKMTYDSDPSRGIISIDLSENATQNTLVAT